MYLKKKIKPGYLEKQRKIFLGYFLFQICSFKKKIAMNK